jgi:hypothetical protein
MGPQAERLLELSSAFVACKRHALAEVTRSREMIDGTSVEVERCGGVDDWGVVYAKYDDKWIRRN